MKLQVRQFTTPSNKKLDVTIVTSNVHVEVNPSDVGIYDRVIMQELIKEIAQTQQVDTSAKRRFKVVVLHEADQLSRDAQAALRRTMERYTTNLRLVLVANGIGRLIEPLKSRCLLIRVPAPSVEEISTCLLHAALSEGITVDNALAKEIALASGRNLRKAMLMLEAMHAACGDTLSRDALHHTEWEEFVGQIATMMTREQSPAQLLTVRGKLYELITHCIDPTTILKTLAFALVDKVDTAFRPTVLQHAAFYEHRLAMGQKAIFHLEAFVARFMADYKRFMLDTFS
jgi:replication factor C subunit 3/5